MFHAHTIVTGSTEEVPLSSSLVARIPRPRPHVNSHDAASAEAPRKMPRTALLDNSTSSAGRRSSSDQSARNFSAGESVAACVTSSEGTNRWIVATVVQYMPEREMYQVRDEEAGEGDTQVYTLTPGHLVALPKSNSTREQNNLPPGSIVLAVYPGTTTFYKATIVSSARRYKSGDYGDYTLEFEDDGDVGGLPQRPVEFRHVVPYVSIS
ncbi:hypothetical protein CYMTET_8917 [Cymbomonas tetramitiformis]|uniref:SGF29 C-terminal domain-containing protein n=1 Tax=Cymbomonas tetramitiformis TaxID=36881 RepID=A0AAE0LG06_9CHLO|nr:hypothetical protein CYMTET_8917 [Cymbomonas tetramitiformis]